jgi:biopolymer transport protein TolQ
MSAALSQAAATEAPTSGAAPTVALDPLSLLTGSSGPVLVVLWLLIAAAVIVWFVTALKLMQLRRWARAEQAFEQAALRAHTAEDMYELARRHFDAPGARVVLALERRNAVPEVLPAAAKRAVVDEQTRASRFMPVLASIGSAGPFVGLFGTVWGIMDAFLRIGREKSASLPVVAPAIGEALIATAIGLFAAIPAVVAYNAIAKRIDELCASVEASAEGWVALSVAAATGTQRESLGRLTPVLASSPGAHSESQPLPLGRRRSGPPPPHR